MLKQTQLEQLKDLTEADLPFFLPKAENADFEFKSSLIPDGKLQSALQKAASGFWNSGGGYFVAGVDEKTGQPDGGISRTVGRTARRDWIDRAIASVSPGHPNGYLIHEIVSSGGAINIAERCAVYVVGFAGSELAPHMAEGSYYIRSGAHTDPASAFIVEALFARRGKRQPQLRLQFRQCPSMLDTLQLGIINVGSTPALDVEIEFKERPHQVRATGGRAIVRIHRIDSDTPFYFDYLNHYNPSDIDKRLKSEPNEVTLRYKDASLNAYEQREVVAVNLTVEASLFGGGDLSRIAGSMQHIVNALCRIESKLRPPE